VELTELAVVELTYLDVASLGHAPGGQFYGTVEGSVTGPRLAGNLRLTNLASARPDSISTPAMRGVLTTEDRASVWVELDGLAMLRPEERTRIFVTSARFSTLDGRYDWLNAVVGVLEGMLDTDTMQAQAQLFECRPTLE